MKEFVFDLRRFDEDRSSLGGLVLLNTVMTTLRLKELAAKFKDDPVGNLKKDASPILKFIGTYLEAEAEKTSDASKKIKSSAKILASLISIVDSAAYIVEHSKDDNPPVTEITKESELIVAELAKVTGEVVNLAGGKKSLVLSVTAAAISLVANGITALDGVTDAEKNKINASYLGFMKSLAFDKALIKKLFNAAIDAELAKIDLDDVTKNLSILKNTTILDDVSKTLTKAGGVLDLVFAAMQGVLNGINKYKTTFAKYTEDGIPEDMAKRDAFINAFTAVIHDTAHAYSKGFDDVAYNGIKTLIWAFTGKEGIQGNYVEVMTEMLKTFNYTNTGDAEDNFLLCYVNDEMIYGYDGNDYIANIASNMKIWGGADSDTIVSREGSGDDYTVPQGNSLLGGPGRDLIMAYDTDSTILGGTDNDRLFILGKKNKLYGEDGVDFFYLQAGADDNTINGGLGGDVIILESVQNAVIEYSEGDGNDLILGYDDSDVIQITGDYSTQTSGQDVIIAVGDGSITLSGAAGKNININNKREVIGEEQEGNTNVFIPIPSFWYPGINEIRSTAGNDKIKNTLDNVMINSGAGNDSINSRGDSVIIDGGSGNDTIYSDIDGSTESGTNINIFGGKGNDFIGSDAPYSTINGGADDDTIYNYGWNVSISGGAGNDSIENLHLFHEEGSNVTIDGGDGDDTITNTAAGTNALIDGGAGNDSIHNQGANATITGGTGNDYVYNDGNNVTIEGGTGDDTVYNYGKNVTINGGSGNDSIRNDRMNVTIDGGTGDDSISNTSKNITIEGGAGDDTVINYGFDVTISGGAGNDSISNGYYGNNVTIEGGEGNDIISLGDNAYYNLIEYRAGDGNDTINGFNEDDTLSISGGEYTRSTVGNDVIIKVGDGSILLKDAKDTTLNIDGTEKASEPVWILSGTTATYGTAGNTLITVSGVKSLEGLSLNGKTVTVSEAALDTETVTISDGYTLALAEGVDTIKEDLSGWTTLSGGNVAYLTGGTDSYYLLSDDGKTITYNAAVAGVKKVEFSGVQGTPTLSGNSVNLTASSFASNVSIVSNGGDYQFNLSGDFDGKTFTGTAQADSIITGGSNVSISGGNGNDLFVYTDGNNTILDYTANKDRISLAGGNSAKWLSHITGVRVNGSDVSLTFSNDKTKTLTLKNSVGKKVSINEDACVFGRDESKSIIIHSTFGGKFNATAYKDVDASACTRAVSILGGTLNNSIVGGKGNDTLLGGAGNDTLTGGTGKDVFIYSAGKDVITDYATGDRISLGSSITKATVKGSNVVITTNSGSLTVKNAKDKTLSLISSAGKSLSTVIGGAKSLTLTNNSSAKITLPATYTTADASKRTTAIKITGNSKANSIVGGTGKDTLLGGAGSDMLNGGKGNDKLYGGSGNDTLIGGAGNDSLWGQAGADTFLYSDGDGKDVIFGFDNTDMLEISGTFTPYVTSSGAISFKVGSTYNAVVLKNFSATTFNVNDATYVISGSKLVKK